MTEIQRLLQKMREQPANENFVRLSTIVLFVLLIVFGAWYASRRTGSPPILASSHAPAPVLPAAPPNVPQPTLPSRWVTPVWPEQPAAFRDADCGEIVTGEVWAVSPPTGKPKIEIRTELPDGSASAYVWVLASPEQYDHAPIGHVVAWKNVCE
jgi:hypothetical protein